MLLAWTLIFTRRHEESQATIRARADAGPEEDDGLDMRHGLEALDLFTVYFGAGAHAELAALEPHRTDASRIEPRARRCSPPRRPMTGRTRAGRASNASRSLVARSPSRRSIDYDQGLFWCGACLVLVYAEEPDALEAWDRLPANAYRGGSLFVGADREALGWVHRRCATATSTGRWTRFEDAGELACSGARASAIDQVPARLHRPDPDRARRLVAEARAALGMSTTDHVAASFPGALWRRAEAEVLAAEGELEQALERLMRVGARIGRLDNPAGHPWRSIAAEVLDRLERPTRASSWRRRSSRSPAPGAPRVRSAGRCG